MHAPVRRSVAVPSQGKRRCPPLPKSTTTQTAATVSPSPPPSPSGKGASEGADALGQILVRLSSPTRLRMNLQPEEPRGTFRRARGRRGPGGGERESEVPGRVTGGKLCAVRKARAEEAAAASGDCARRHAVPAPRARTVSASAPSSPSGPPACPLPSAPERSFRPRTLPYLPAARHSHFGPTTTPKIQSPLLATAVLPPEQQVTRNQPYLPRTLLALSLCPLSFPGERKGMQAVGVRGGDPGHRRDLL